jgi:putative peptidoglycan lipid II flippase
MTDTMGFAVRMVVFICLPSMCGLYLLRTPVVRLLFQYGEFDEVSLQMTTWALTFHLTGLVFIALSRIYVQAFYSRMDTRTPVYIAAGAMVVNIVACLTLRGPLANGGIALANSLAAAFQVVLLVALLRSQLAGIWSAGTWVAIGKSILAAGGMSAAVIGLVRLGALEQARSIPLQIAWLSAAIGIGVLVYGGLSWALRSRELGEVAGMFARRLSRGRSSGRS